MSVSSSLDPVGTVIDILESTDNTDYTASKPPFIEEQQEVSQSTKEARSQDAIYVYAPGDGAYDQFDFAWDKYTEAQRVTIDPWVARSAAGVRALHRDIRDIFLPYVNDNKSTTNFNRFWPVAPIPLEHERRLGGEHYRKPYELRLHALR